MAISSSSSLVDLGEEADLNEVTSKIFFSDSSASGPILSWPAATTEIDSTLKSLDSLVALCSKHAVPSELTPVCAQHLGWRACTPPPVGSNKMCVYAAALDAGLRFPLHPFYIRILQHYRLAPSQLSPNSWSYLAAFVLLCQDAGVEPLVSAFRYFFSICAQRHQGKPTGFHHFQPYIDGSRRLFTGNLRREKWKSKFFFLDCPSGWKCPVKWGKPRRVDARRVQRTVTVIDKMKLKQKEIGCIDIKVFLANREMPVGDPAPFTPLQSAEKAEAGAGAAGAAGDGAAAVCTTAENTSTRKRSRLSPAPVLSQRQPLPTSARAAGLAPIRASSTGGHCGHIPPPSFPPIRASSTGGRRGDFPPPPQQSFGESTSAPWQLPGMRVRAQAVSFGGSSEINPPAPHTCDALQLWEAMAKASELEALIAKLNHELHLVTTWNTDWQKRLRDAEAKHAAEMAELIARNTDGQKKLRAAEAKHHTEMAELVAHLRAANDRNKHLNEVLVRLDKEYAAERNELFGHLRAACVEVEQLKAASVEVAQLKAEHAAESAQLKKELQAEAERLKEELAEDAEQLKHEGYTMGASDMRDLTLAMFKDVISPHELKVDMLLDYGLQIQSASPVPVEDK